MLIATDITKNGTFSSSNLPHRACRFSGQQSSKSSTNGAVTSIALDINPSASASIVTPYHATDLVRTYRAYAPIVATKKNPDIRSFRSETHATDSIRSGCTANSAATSKLRRAFPVMYVSTR